MAVVEGEPFRLAVKYSQAAVEGLLRCWLRLLARMKLSWLQKAS